MKNFPVGKVGVGITIVYFIGLGIAMHCYGLKKFESYNELGDFLAGAFSPVAFLWLVLGFFQQQKELQQNTDALKLQAQELQNSVDQYKQMVEVAQMQLDSDLTRAQQETLMREIETRPSVKLDNFGWRSRAGSIYNYGANVKVGSREARNIRIEFVGGFGRFQEFTKDFADSGFSLGETALDYSIVPNDLTVLISYESSIGIKYKYQYRYFNLVNGNYSEVQHVELKTT